jgi:hypothetical protein
LRVQFWKPVRGMRIDKSKLGDAKVFRTDGWDIALIVSDDIKDALERHGAGSPTCPTRPGAR